jgi:putative transposase
MECAALRRFSFRVVALTKRNGTISSMSERQDDREIEERPPRDWAHAPVHRISEDGVYMVTAATYQKQPIFSGDARLSALTSGLMKYVRLHSWKLEAWAVFPNHYHFIGHPVKKGGSKTLRTMLAEFHKKSASWVNSLDGTIGRKVWHNFWESLLTYQKSYLARQHYVHANAVKHGIVSVANQYQWCSAAWFEKHSTPAQIKTVYGFKIDKLHIDDDY